MKNYIKKYGIGMLLSRILIIAMGFVSLFVYTLCVYGYGTGEYKTFALFGISFATTFGVSSIILWGKLRTEEAALK